MATILIVEDDEQVRAAAESFLADEGHRTLTVATTEQAWALLEGNAGIDLVVTGIALNGDSQAGLTLARRAADIRKNLKVVYTAGERVTDRIKALFVPSSAFLPKSFTVDDIRKALFAHFEIRSPGENFA